MTRRDHYYNKAKQEGYRTRAAYKLRQLDRHESILETGDTVVDLGAAPGGWLQVAAESVGPTGTVVGVDRQSIEPLDTEATVRTVRADVTNEDVGSVIASELPNEKADVVLSDMAPEMTGEYEVDQARSVYLAQRALAIAREVLRPGGHLVTKVFEGRDVQALRTDATSTFEFVTLTAPEASRDSSAELYLVAKRFVAAPVSQADRLTVEIESTGSDGDGMATVDGYRIFVPGTTPGDEVQIEIDEIKQRYAFATVVE